MPERTGLPRRLTAGVAAPRLLLQGYYGAGNFGDEWLLAALLDAIRARHPGAGITVRGHGAFVPLPEGVRALATEAVLGQAGRSRIRRLGAYMAELTRQMRHADCLVFGGGTQFQDRTGLAGLATQAMMCALARALGVRVAALGIGVAGCTAGPGLRLLRAIVAMSTPFAVRDAPSLAAAGPRAVAGADLAFALPLRPRAPGADLGVTLVPGALGGGTARARLLGALAAALPGALAPGGRVRLLALQAKGVTPGDAGALVELGAMLPGALPPVLLTGPDDAALDGLAMVCGMRFHALVAAAQLGLPFVGIAHDHKLQALCAAHAMPWLSPAEADAVALSRALDTAAGRRPDPAVNATMQAAARAMLECFLDALEG